MNSKNLSGRLNPCFIGFDEHPLNFLEREGSGDGEVILDRGSLSELLAQLVHGDGGRENDHRKAHIDREFGEGKAGSATTNSQESLSLS